MKYRYMFVFLFSFFLFSQTVWAQDSSLTTEKKKSKDNRLLFRLSEQDIILPVTSIEWGTPDRWSFTSRYIHSFQKEKKRRIWHTNFGVFISPGWSGGRIGVSFLGIYSPPSQSLREFAIFGELRGVLLRTWGNPLSTISDSNFIGVELKICISWLLNTSAGYYSPVSNAGKNITSFWGFHFGIGI